MPVQFSQSARLERDEGSSDGFGAGEVGRVDLVELASASTNLLRLVLEGSVDKGASAGSRRSDGARDGLGSNRSVDDVGVFGWNFVEDGFVDAEILGQDRLRSASHPVVKIESRTDLVKIAVVENEKELVFVLEALDRVRNSLGEVPDIAVVEFLCLVYTVFIYGSHQNAALVHNTPFSLLALVHLVERIKLSTYNTMPMEFARGSLFEMLLSPCNIVTGREVGNDLLANPAAIEDLGLGVREAPLEVRDGACI